MGDESARSDSDLGDQLTPRVAQAVVLACKVPGEEGEFEETLTPEALTSWDEVQDKLKKLSLANLDIILKPCEVKPPPGSGINGRCDVATEYLKGVVRQTRADIREENRVENERRAAEEAKKNRELNAVLLIQSWFRAWGPRYEFVRHMRATAKSRKMRKDAEDIAARWRRVGPPPECAVVWLHGRGESEVSWQEHLRGLTGDNCRWIWPRAPVMSGVTQWFEVLELPVCPVIRGVPDRPRREENKDQLVDGVMRVHLALYALEMEGVPADRIVLAGFGQGAALAIHAALRFPRPLAGVALVSAWLTCLDELTNTANEESIPTPFLWCHGACDAVVQPKMALEHKKQLQELGVKVDFTMFPALRFGLDAEVKHLLRTWLAERLKRSYSLEEAAAAAEGGGPDAGG